MTMTIAVLGAGSGLGASVARRFGAEGYQIALVARRVDALAEAVRSLEAAGVAAAAFPADLTDLGAIPRVLDDIRARFGGVDVLYFGPASSDAFTPAEKLTAAQVAGFAPLFTYAPIEAIRAALPEMLEKGRGTILYANGASAIQAPPQMSGPGPAMAATRNYLQTLHAEVADRGVYVGALFIAAMIKNSAAYAEAAKWGGGDGGFPVADPDELADILWRLHLERDRFERVHPA